MNKVNHSAQSVEQFQNTQDKARELACLVADMMSTR
jgi:hypothetical protein